MSFNYDKVVKDLYTGLRQTLNMTSITGKDSIGKFAISQEGFEPENIQLLTKASETVDDMVKNAISSLQIAGESFTAAQEKAARLIAQYGFKPNDLTSKLQSMYNANDVMTVSVEDAVGFNELTISSEAYDGQKADNSFLYSVAYNFAAAKQDEFGEAFYPTIVIDPTLKEVKMEIKFASLMNEFQRGTDGKPNRGLFNKIPLVKAIYEPSIFATDKNKLLPILRDENKKYLLESEKREDDSILEKVVTAPLLFGKEINLLGISQTDAQLARGQQDNTDALDSAIVLEAIYVQLTKDSTDEIFKCNTSNLSFNGFVANPQNHNKDMILNFTRQRLVFNTTNTKTSKGAKADVFDGLPEDYTVEVEVSVVGEANTQSGDVVLYGNKAEVVVIKNAAGDKLVSTDSEFQEIAKVFESIKFLGYDLLAYSTNSNLRKRGQLITVDTFKQSYLVPNRSGIMSIVPVNNDTGTDNDTDPIIGQAQACGAKISIDAVEALLKHVEFMRVVTDGGKAQKDFSLEDHGFKGVAKNVVNPTYVHTVLDLAQNVSSLRSFDRDDDIKSNILQNLYNVAMELWINSNYGIVYKRVLNANVSQKPTLIIGCDPNTERLLVTEAGSNRISKGAFDMLIVSTFNNRMTGKIIMSFGVFDDSRNSTANPLNFGNCIFAPNIVYDLVRDIGGQTSREKHTNPRYLHITNLPIVAEIDISNVNSTFAPLTFKTQNV